MTPSNRNLPRGRETFFGVQANLMRESQADALLEIALARDLGAMRDGGDLAAALATSLPGWRVRFDAAVARVARRERRTYFNETTLRRALAAP